MEQVRGTRLFGQGQANFSNITNSSNCNEFSAEEQRTLNIIVISVSSTASLACILAILFILLSKGHKKFIQRLVLYLMVAALVEAVVSILQVVPVQYSGNVGKVRKGFQGFCAAVGFLIEVALWLELSVMCWIVIVIVLVFKRCDTNAVKLKHEVCGLTVVLILPFTLNWIPFVKGMYGLSGGGCWIKPSVNSYCEYDGVGLAFIFLLSYGPAFLVCLLTFVSFGTITIVMCKRALQQEQGLHQSTVHWQGIKEILPLVLYPLIYFLLWIGLAVTRVYTTLQSRQDKKLRYSLVLIHSTFSFLARLLVPLIFLLHLIIRFWKKYRNKPRLLNTITSFSVSNEFTDQEDEALIIRGQCTTLPVKEYKSIFDGNINAA